MNTAHENAALRAAYALAEATEWSAAGLMLRVSLIPRPLLALSFALNARAECRNDEGRRICSTVIDRIEEFIDRSAC